MTTATYKRGEIRTAVYTNGSGSAIPVDSIIVGGVVHNKTSRIMIARETIPDGATGIVAVSGVFRFPKVSTAVIKAGEAMNWDASEEGIEDNAATSAVGDVAQFGCAMADAGNGATSIDVDISHPGTYDGNDD